MDTCHRKAPGRLHSSACDAIRVCDVRSAKKPAKRSHLAAVAAVLFVRWWTDVR